MDGGRARWTDDYHFSPFASQRKHSGGFRGGFDGNPGFHEWETGTAPDLGRRLQCELVRIDRLSSCGRVDRKTENADGHERFTACASFAHCRGRIGLDGDDTWMDADSERELFTRSSWSNPEDSLTQMDFIMTSRKLEARRAQVLDSDWFKTDHRAVLAVLSLKTQMRYTMKSDVKLRGWKPDDSWQRR